jgi:putative phosphoesterase
MRICAVSDTHGEIQNLRRVFDQSRSRYGVKAFFHLGDDYDDMRGISQDGVEIVRVPGIFSSYYTDRSIENRLIRSLDGWKFLLSHTPEGTERDLPGDMDPQGSVLSDGVDVLLHGHTHIPEIVQEPGYIRVNPGHLKDGDKKGYPPTFALIDAQPSRMEIQILLLINGDTYQARSFSRNMPQGNPGT